MTSKAEELAERARKLAEKRAAAEKAKAGAGESAGRDTKRPVDAPAKQADFPAAQSGVRVKPVRCTVDIPAGRFARVKAWQGETAVQLGRSRVTNQDLLETLVERLLTDETLARKIRDDLRRKFAEPQ